MYPRQSGTAVAEPDSRSGSATFSDKRVEEALTAVHRTLVTSVFYPSNHPLLRGAEKEGYRAWAKIENDPRLRSSGLRLRSGSLWLGDVVLAESSPAVVSLAKTLAGHGLMCVIQRRPLTEEGFSQWVALLAATPNSLAPEGGLVGVWKSSPFSACLDLRRLAIAPSSRGDEEEDAFPAAETGSGDGPDPSEKAPSGTNTQMLSRLEALEPRQPGEGQLQDLLLRLGRTDHADEFVQLLRDIAALAQKEVQAERFTEAFGVALFLYREAQNMSAIGKGDRRDALVDTLCVLLRGALLSWVIGFIVTEQGREEAETGEYILRTVGKPVVVPLINALVLEKDWRGRKKLVDLLIAIGPPVIPHAVRMLDDQRWFVVRNMVTILGGISTPDALQALWRLVGDPDGRLRRELVRAATRATGPAAEAILLALLDDSDPAVRLMAISGASFQRTQEVYEALWERYERIGIRIPEWNLKAQLLQTLGRMGFPDAVERLEAVLAARPLLWRRRWEVVHAAAVHALGALGGRKARALLEKFLDHRSPAVRRAAVRSLSSCGDRRMEEEPCPGD